MRSEAPEDRPSLFVSGVLLSLSKPLVLPRIRSDDFPGSLQDTVGATPRVTQAGGAIDAGRRVGARVAHRCHWRRRGGRARRGGGRLVPGRAAAAALDNQFKYRLRPRPRPRRGRPQESFNSCGPPGRPREDACQDVGAQGPERTRGARRGYVFGAQPRAPGRAPVVRRLARRKGGPRLLRRAARRLSHSRRRSIDCAVRRVARVLPRRPGRLYAASFLCRLHAIDATSTRLTGSHTQGAATALVECFRSFTSSGYFMEDLHGAQFTLAGNDIYAIDAPETLPNAPVAAVLDWTVRKGGTSWGGLKYVEMRLSVHQNCTVDGDCPATSDIELCAFRDCVPGWDQGAREARGWCRKGWCALVDARAHTYDLATRAWCASRVPFSSLRNPRRPAVSQLSPLRSRPRRHRRASTPSTRFICAQGAAVDFEGGPVPVPASKAAPGRVNKAHAKRGARGPAESLRCSRGARLISSPALRARAVGSGSVNCG